MTDSLLSICLPIVDDQSLSDTCMQSLLQQSFADYELIIGFDPQCEQTKSKIEQLAKNDPRIQLLPLHDKTNIWAAYNQCFSAAKGKFIKPFSANCVLPPHLLERAVEVLVGNDGISVFSGYPHTVQGINQSSEAPVRLLTTPTDCVTPGKIAARKILQSVCALDFKPELLFFRASNGGILFDETLSALAGTDFILRLLSKGNFYLMSDFKLNSESSIALDTRVSECDFAVEIVKLTKLHISLIEQLGLSKEDFINNNLKQVSDRLLASWTSSRMPLLTAVSRDALNSDELARQLAEHKELIAHSLLLLAKSQVNAEAEKDEQIQELESKLQAMLRSKSWKVTKILRMANNRRSLGTNIRQLISKQS